MPQRDPATKPIPADYALRSHIAALGIVFSTGRQPAGRLSPRRLRRRAWRQEPVGARRRYKVVYIPATGGRDGLAQDGLTGFRVGCDMVRWPPAGLAVDGRGGPLTPDDGGNTAWRVTGAGR